MRKSFNELNKNTSKLHIPMFPYFIKIIAFYRFLFIILFYPNFLQSYVGEEEVFTVFNQITNLSNPTQQEYELIENFLLNGHRPYLDEIYNSDRQKNFSHEDQSHRDRRNLMLIGPQKEMPLFEIHNINSSPKSKERCITIYASYNSPYPEKAKQLLKELKNCGYKGHVLLRIGGYPNLQLEGLKLCHIPYSWKIAFIHEAINLGYKNILWLDTSMHPITDLSQIFKLIEEQGYLFLSGGVNLDYGYNLKTHLPNAIYSLGIELENLVEIPHIVSCVFGINTKSEKAAIVMKDWLDETKKVMPCMTWFPEELSFSVVAWKNQAIPLMHWGLVVCTEENKHLLKSYPNWNFVLDLIRK